MNWLDIVLIVLLFIPTFIGLRKGLIKTVLSLAGLIVGILLAGNLYKPVSGIFGFINNESIANILAFVLILTIVFIIAMLLARLLKALANLIMIGWLDHLGGAIFGFLSGFLILGAIMATIVKFFGSDPITESFMAKVMLDYFPIVLGLLPGEFQAIQDFFQS
ncbi:MAG: CvpA family protein [Dehalococcoidales bacterium]|nr:CvpA family protein [Dehalococcoidales bacterium]